MNQSLKSIAFILGTLFGLAANGAPLVTVVSTPPPASIATPMPTSTFLPPRIPLTATDPNTKVQLLLQKETNWLSPSQYQSSSSTFSLPVFRPRCNRTTECRYRFAFRATEQPLSGNDAVQFEQKPFLTSEAQDLTMRTLGYQGKLWIVVQAQSSDGIGEPTYFSIPSVDNRKPLAGVELKAYHDGVSVGTIRSSLPNFKYRYAFHEGAPIAGDGTLTAIANAPWIRSAGYEDKYTHVRPLPSDQISFSGCPGDFKRLPGSTRYWTLTLQLASEWGILGDVIQIPIYARRHATPSYRLQMLGQIIGNPPRDFLWSGIAPALKLINPACDANGDRRSGASVVAQNRAQVRAAIENAGGPPLFSTAIFSSFDPSLGGRYSSPSWLGAWDLSGVDWFHPRAGTLITRQHMVVASHYQREVGEAVSFVAHTGEIIRRRIAQIRYIPDSDIEVLQLDSPVPDFVPTYPLLDPRLANRYQEVAGAIGIVTNQFREALLFAADLASETGFKFTSDLGLYPPGSESDSVLFNRSLIRGDSSHPFFIPLDGQLILIGSLSFGGFAPSGSALYGPNYLDAINAFVLDAGTVP